MEDKRKDKARKIVTLVPAAVIFLTSVVSSFWEPKFDFKLRIFVLLAAAVVAGLLGASMAKKTKP